MSNYYNRQWRLPNNENKDKQSNYSMNFDGTNDAIEIDSIGSTISAMTTISISVWIKTTSSAFSYILFTGRYSTGSIGLAVSSGTVYGVVGVSGGFSELQTTATVNDGNWHHLVMTFNNSNGTIELYIDNSLDPSSSTTNGTIPTNVIYADIGQRAYDNDFRFNGQIDGLSIFDYELSSSQVTTLYGSSSTGIGNPMSLSRAPVAYYPLGDQDSFNGANYLVPNSSLKDYVFSFPSSGTNYIKLGSSGVNIGQQNTISIWVNFNGTIKDDHLISTYAGKWMINPHVGSGYLCYAATDGTGSGTPYACIGSLTYPTGWFLLTVVRNNTNFSLYFNDQLQGSNSSSTFTSDTIVGMIGTGAVANQFTHDVSNLTIFNTALSATGSNSVETLYNNGSPLTSMSGFTSLQGWWKLDASATFDESASSWSIPDDSTNSNTTTSLGLTQSALEQSDLSFKTSYSPYAFDFDGATDYIRILPFGTGMNLSDSWSVSIWINTTTTLGNKGILTSRNASTPYDFFSFGPKTKSNGKIETWLEGIGYTELTPVINDGNWHHLTFAYDHSSTTIKVYTDNSESYSSTSYDNGTGRVLETIGAAYTSWYWIGKLSNLSVWNKQLTPTEVSEIYSEGIPQNLLNHSAVSSLVSWWQLGSNSSFNTNWTVLNEISTGSNGTSQGMFEDDIVDGVNSYANGLSSGMGGDEVIGDASYSTANALSVNMGVEDRVTDTPS